MIPRESEEQQNTRAEQEIGEEQAEDIRQALTEEQEKAENHLANWQRAEADLAN